MINIIKGNLLDAEEKYIAHQTNSISTSASGIAKQIFDKYPYSNTYHNRVKPSEPGTIEVLGDGFVNRFVINMYAQYYPGKPGYGIDSKEMREKYFHQCLLQIAKISNLESIAFPFGIGTGLAKGSWDYYFGTIGNFEKHVKNKYGTKVVLYRLLD
jgi:O-acetyl-ADP-ribose deacetylase (regulator of RNase III)